MTPDEGSSVYPFGFATSSFRRSPSALTAVSCSAAGGAGRLLSGSAFLG